MEIDFFYPLTAIIVFILIELYCRKTGLLPIVTGNDIQKKEFVGRASKESINYFLEVYNESNEILFVGGECYHKFWDDEDVIKAIELGNVKIKIASGPHYDILSTKLARLINNGHPKIIYYPQRKREFNHHFYISDKNEIGYHKGNESDNKQIVLSGDKCIADVFRKYFFKKIKKTNPIPAGKLLKCVKLSYADIAVEVKDIVEIDKFKDAIS